MNTYQLNFKGYWREINKVGIPNASGIYLVYRSVYNSSSNTVGLKEIIYIGQAENVNSRLQRHEKQHDFENQLQRGEELCYSFAPVEKQNLDIVENALLLMQKPKLNKDSVNSYNHEDASFTIDGRCALLKSTDFSIS